MKIMHSRAGFSLVEVAIALGISAFCLLSILGVIPVGLNSNQTSIQQTVATGLMSAVATDLQATPQSTPSSAQTSLRFQLTVPKCGGEESTQTLYFGDGGAAIGTPGANATGDARCRVTVTLKPPTNTTNRSVTTAYILVTWPALADPLSSSAPSKYSGSIETIVALDRN
jgi:uncharacterized protein (TIGR02598 family)